MEKQFNEFFHSHYLDNLHERLGALKIVEKNNLKSWAKYLQYYLNHHDAEADTRFLKYLYEKEKQLSYKGGLL